MRKSARKKRRAPKRRRYYFGTQFDERRTEEGKGDINVLLQDRVTGSCVAGSTHIDHLIALGGAAKPPLKIKHLSPQLKELRLPRGKTFYGYLFNEIEKILLNHPKLRWWLEADGLVVDEVRPQLDSLSDFDRIVGPLSVQLLQKGRLSQDALSSIAGELDAKGFQLKEHLQPQEWDDIVNKNRKRTGNLINNFSLAAKHSTFRRTVRRSIYRARDRYKKALNSLSF